MAVPRIGRRDHIEQEKIDEKIEREQTALDDAALGGEYEPQQVPMSPAEKAALEAERAAMVADLKEHRSPRPGPERTAPISLSNRAIEPLSDEANLRPSPVEEELAVEVPPTPELTEATAALASVEAEIEQLESEARDLVKAQAASKKEADDLHATKLAILRAKRTEAEAREKEARQDAAVAALAQHVIAADALAKRNRELERGSFAQRQAAVAERLQPAIDAARRTLKGLRSFERENGPALQKMAGLTWRNAPAEWPVRLRQRLHQEVYEEVRKLYAWVSLELSDKGISRAIQDAEDAIATAAPRIADVLLAINAANDEKVPAYRQQLSELMARMKVIEEAGAHEATPGKVPEVIVILDGGARQDVKEDILAKGRREAYIATHPATAELPKRPANDE